MHASCPLCGGATVSAMYWAQVVADRARFLGIPADECSTCGHLAPNRAAVLALAEDAPEWLVRRCLAIAPPADRSGRRAHVLIVDDDTSTRRVVRRVLEREDYIVSESEDGSDALRLLEQLAGSGALPNLVLVDSIMPRMGGRDFVRILRHAYPHIIAIAMSGIDTRIPLADGALPKPIRPAALLSVVRELTV